MKKLSKKQREEFTEKIDAIECAKDELETEVEDFNSKMETLKESPDLALLKLNERVEEFNVFRDGIAADMESYYDNRSDRWRALAVGDAYCEWLSQWQEERDVEIQFDQDYEPLRLPDVEVPHDEEYPEEPGGC